MNVASLRTENAKTVREGSHSGIILRRTQQTDIGIPRCQEKFKRV
jgi:hypothetical protein